MRYNRNTRRLWLTGFRSTRFLHVPAISVPIPKNLSFFFACEMPLEANLLIESGSGKEKPMLTFVSMTSVSMASGMASGMTFGGVAGCSPQ